jgi:hypothetical protein
MSASAWLGRPRSLGSPTESPQIQTPAAIPTGIPQTNGILRYTLTRSLEWSKTLMTSADAGDCWSNDQGWKTGRTDRSERAGASALHRLPSLVSLSDEA